MNKRKPGMRSIDEWELDGLEILAEQDASAQTFEEVQIEEETGLIEWQKEQDLQYAIAETMPHVHEFDEVEINLKDNFDNAQSMSQDQDLDMER